MRDLAIILLIYGLTAASCSNAQVKALPTDSAASKAAKIPLQFDRFEFSLATAHPNAQKLMPDEFFWSPIEETGPFGSDDGSDAALGFYKWRQLNKFENPTSYLRDLIKSWNYPTFDWHELDTVKITLYMESSRELDESTIQVRIEQFKEAMRNSPDTAAVMSDEKIRELVMTASKQMNSSFLLGQDNAIVGTAFAQIALEGKIGYELQMMAMIAIKRQLLPFLINRYDEGYRIKRKEQLTKMLNVIKAVSSLRRNNHQ